MLQPILHQLRNQRIILASGSPRRQELIRNLGFNAELCPSLFEENLDPKSFPNLPSYIEETAKQKVLEVDQRLRLNTTKPPDLVIGADTMVCRNGKLYGKPKTNDIAFQMLSELMGNQHTVYTAVVIKKDDKISQFTEKTDVFFSDATTEQIQGYVDTGECLDKAGAYGIQGIGGCFIEKIEGDYFTVMGLPLNRLCKELIKLYA